MKNFQYRYDLAKRVEQELPKFKSDWTPRTIPATVADITGWMEDTQVNKEVTELLKGWHFEAVGMPPAKDGFYTV